MEDLAGTGNYETLKKLTDEERLAFIQSQAIRVGSEVSEAVNQIIKERCFKACVPQPSKALSQEEQKCTINCVDRFYEAHAIVEYTYLRTVRHSVRVISKNSPHQVCFF